MKVIDLITKLQNCPMEMEVCIFDHKTNLNEDSGDGTGAGIYPTFTVEVITKADTPDNSPEWIALAFENEYTKETE